MNRSYWDNLLLPSTFDATIIGAGIVGLSTAIHLKQRHPEWKIAVFERGLSTAGASTKNAGFACFGSLSEIIDDLDSMPDETVVSLIRERWEGINYLRELTNGYDIDYQNCGGFELFTEDQQELYEQCCARFEGVNSILSKNFGQPVFSHTDERLKEFGFRQTKHLISNPFEGQLHTGKLMRALTDLCRKSQIYLYFGAAVDHWFEQSEKIHIQVNERFSFESEHLVVATNGFAKELIPILEVEPTRAQCLITEPVTHLKVRGTFHIDRGYYYFRNVDNRILLGGARNMDRENEFTTNTETTELIQSELERVLHQIILPEEKVSIAQRWTGTMGTGPSKQPILKKLSSRVTVAVRLGGMGIAIGSIIGKNAAGLVGT